MAEPGSFEPIRRCESNRHLDHVAACLSLATRWSLEFSGLIVPADDVDVMPRPASAGRANHTWKETRHGAPPFVPVDVWRSLVLLGFARRPPPRPRSSSPAMSAKDFNPATNPNVVTTPVSSNPLNIGQSQWITANGWVSGWSIQDIRTNYDATTDTLSVGINTFKNASGQYAPFGQANGDPSGTATAYDPAHLGGDKSVALAIAPINPTNLGQPGNAGGRRGRPGRQDDRRHRNRRLHRLSVQRHQGGLSGLAYSFGTSLPQNMGNLAFDPARPIPNSSSPSRTSARSPGWIPPRDSGSRPMPARARTASPERPTCPGRRCRPMLSRTSPNRPPGWPGRSRSAPSAWRRSPPRPRPENDIRSIEPMIIDASLRKAAARTKVAAFVHRPVPTRPSLPFSQCAAPPSTLPVRTAQAPWLSGITWTARPFKPRAKSRPVSLSLRTSLLAGQTCHQPTVLLVAKTGCHRLGSRKTQPSRFDRDYDDAHDPSRHGLSASSGLVARRWPRGYLPRSNPPPGRFGTGPRPKRASRKTTAAKQAHARERPPYEHRDCLPVDRGLRAV